MEQWSVSHKALQIICADFWSSAADCQLILDEIGLSSVRINLSEPSIMRWMSILRELMRMNDGAMNRLVVVLMKQYPGNKALRNACAPWIPSTPATSVPGQPEAQPVPVVPPGGVLIKKFEAAPAPSPGPVPVPVVAPPDDEAALVLPRIDTLWEAMIDMEQRMIGIEGSLRDMLVKRPAKKSNG